MQHIKTIIKIIITVIPLVLQTAIANNSCTSQQEFDAAKADANTTMRSIASAQGEIEKKIEATLKKRAAEKKWEAQHTGQILMRILTSPQFAAFEKEKEPLTTELLKLASSQSNNNASCKDFINLKEISTKINSINIKQYEYISNEISKAE